MAASGPISAALRPVEHRVQRECPACGQFDDHPRHVWQYADGTTADLHMDCCGCIEYCAPVLAAAGDKRGPELIKHVTKGMS